MANIRSRSCPGCGSADGSRAGSKNGFEIRVCKVCSSLYTSALPEENEALNYDEYYTAANLQVPAFIIDRVNVIVNGFAKYRGTNRFLDIGFGAGTMLDVASSLGWDVYGQEVSEPAVLQAKEKGIDAFCGTLMEAGYPEAFFDVITCSEILEHLPDPQAVLDEVVRILRPGGLFWATTPSARGISYRLMGTNWTVLSPPEHTQLYSKQGMRKMLQNAGFSTISMKTFGTNPAEIVAHYRSGSSRTGDSGACGFNRVQAGYDLNEKLSRSPTRRFVKSILNNSLNLFGVGDSLKIFARK